MRIVFVKSRAPGLAGLTALDRYLATGHHQAMQFTSRLTTALPLPRHPLAALGVRSTRRAWASGALLLLQLWAVMLLPVVHGATEHETLAHGVVVTHEDPPSPAGHGHLDCGICQAIAHAGPAPSPVTHVAVSSGLQAGGRPQVAPMVFTASLCCTAAPRAPPSA